MKLNQFAMAIAAFTLGAAQAATLQTTDFIAAPAHFNGFEGIAGGANGAYGPTYGITVTQVNGQVNDIWTTHERRPLGGLLRGGFDEIRLRDNGEPISSLTGGLNALVLDSIKVASPVPEPETYALMLAGLGVMGFVARRRRS